MREIKFRGKRLDNGEWVYGSLIIFDKNSYFIFKGHEGASSLSYGQLLNTLMIMVEPESVGQYTELKDKNGVEIYEGDVVKVFDLKDKMKFKGKISFKNGSYVIESNIATHYRFIDYEIEVIGNVWED